MVSGPSGRACKHAVSETLPEISTRLILGLGNPGETYRDTRHNCGFLVIEELVSRRGLSESRMECGSRCFRDRSLILAAPETFMNRSGHAARCFAELEDLCSEQILVIYDDVHLDLGRLRLRPSGGPGGHRGLESIVESLRTESIPRLRMGIRQSDSELDGEAIVDFVLGSFATDEMEEVFSMVKRAADACEAWLDEGMDSAMNRFNRPAVVAE